MPPTDAQQSAATEPYGAGQGHREEHGAPAAEEENLKDEFCALDFSVRKSIRYHCMRRRFFDNAHHLSAALAALSGSAVFVSLMANQQATLFAQAASMVVAVATTLDLVIGFSGKALMYDKLQKRFGDLLIDLTGAVQTQESLKKLTTARFMIEKDEPSILNALDMICHNEEAQAQGRNDHLYEITPWQRTAAQIWPFAGVVFKKHPS